MAMPMIRPMMPADVPEATRALFDDNWGDRRLWFEFATSQPACRAFVAEVDGRIVGTGVGTANGPVGWIGTIWVEPRSRGAGLGRALTEAVIEALEAAGCRTLVLVATDAGLRLYERMGFEHQARYQILEIPGLAADPVPLIDPGSGEGVTAGRPGPGVTAGRPGEVTAFRGDDLPDLCRLDQSATGEDRAHVIARFASPEGTKVLRRGDEVVGFVIRAPWGGGATIAPDEAAAHGILHARRVASGPAGRVRVGIVTPPAGDDARLARLAAIGLEPVWSAPRLIRGEPLAWHPERIWGQFNHAMG